LYLRGGVWGQKRVTKVKEGGMEKKKGVGGGGERTFLLKPKGLAGWGERGLIRWVGGGKGGEIKILGFLLVREGT